MVVRAVVVRTSVWSALGLGEWGNGGRDVCGEEGRAPRPFKGSEVERGGKASEGNGRRRWCAIME
jgi:hypothetical protein